MLEKQRWGERAGNWGGDKVPAQHQAWLLLAEDTTALGYKIFHGTVGSGESKMQQAKQQPPNPGTGKCDLMRKGSLRRREQIKDPAMKTLPWISQRARKHHKQCNRSKLWLLAANTFIRSAVLRECLRAAEHSFGLWDTAVNNNPPQIPASEMASSYQQLSGDTVFAMEAHKNAKG
ncbi:hypothetical protein VULLAG_LOCUS4873 [Vulpes lagopus]